MYKVVYQTDNTQLNSLPMTQKEMFAFIKAIFKQFEIQSFYVEKIKQ